MLFYRMLPIADENQLAPHPAHTPLTVRPAYNRSTGIAPPGDSPSGGPAWSPVPHQAPQPAGYILSGPGPGNGSPFCRPDCDCPGAGNTAARSSERSPGKCFEAVG